MKQEARWLQQKNCFSRFKVKKVRQDNFEILASLHAVDLVCTGSKLSLVLTKGSEYRMHLGNISKPEYFGKEVQNGYQGTFWTEPIGHV